MLHIYLTQCSLSSVVDGGRSATDGGFEASGSKRVKFARLKNPYRFAKFNNRIASKKLTVGGTLTAIFF